MPEGYVYIMSNESYREGIYKIGFTKNHPEERARQIYQSEGVPTKFKVEFFTFCTDMILCEKIIHSWLYRYRINGKREFFEIDIDRAIDLLIKAASYQVSITTEKALRDRSVESNYDDIMEDAYNADENEEYTYDKTIKISGLLPYISDMEQKIIDAVMEEKCENIFSFNRIAKKVWGSHGGRQHVVIRDVLAKHGIA